MLLAESDFISLLLWNLYELSAHDPLYLRKQGLLPGNDCMSLSQLKLQKPQWKLSPHIYNCVSHCNGGKCRAFTDVKCHCCCPISKRKKGMRIFSLACRTCILKVIRQAVSQGLAAVQSSKGNQMTLQQTSKAGKQHQYAAGDFKCCSGNQCNSNSSRVRQIWQNSSNTLLKHYMHKACLALLCKIRLFRFQI